MTRRVRIALPPEVRAPALARRALERSLDLPPPLLDDAQLLVSEVVGNAVRRAGLGPASASS